MIVHSEGQERILRENMKGGDGTVRQTVLTDALPAKARLFATLTLAPGTSIGYHVHENETELFYFAAGHGEAQDDDQVVEVKAGDCMVTSNGHGHGVRNTGSEDLVLVACIIKD
ncbi:MAG: cupin domain-containing protein [Clostridia bacterium]|nr:cupin domain-containing protein [Clostridia bacterium]